MTELVERIIADLRKEADAWNVRAMSPNAQDETRASMLRRYQDLRRLANRYEAWLEKAVKAP